MFLIKQINSGSTDPLEFSPHTLGGEASFLISLYRNSSRLHMSTASLAPRAGLWALWFTTTICFRGNSVFPSQIIDVLNIFFLIDFFGLAK